jgi:hypothetical protein
MLMANNRVALTLAQHLRINDVYVCPLTNEHLIVTQVVEDRTTNPIQYLVSFKNSSLTAVHNYNDMVDILVYG